MLTNYFTKFALKQSSSLLLRSPQNIFRMTSMINQNRLFSDQITKSQNKIHEQVQDKGIKLREASEKQEFYGLPLKKMPPKNQSDLLFKLNQQFNSIKDLLNFFESNRDVFSESETHDPYRVLFSRLLGFQRSLKNDQNKKDQKTSSKEFDIINEPQFKVLISDFNRYIGKESAKYRKFTNKQQLFDGFLPIFESLIMLHHGKRFSVKLPDNVRNTYVNMMNHESYLRQLSPQQIARLIYCNASPSLLNLSIKTITNFAHKLADCLCDSSVSDTNQDESKQKVDALSQLNAKEIFEVVYGFGQIHLVPHSELLFRLEPFILARIPEFQPDSLNQLTGFYLRLQRGTEDFLKQLLAQLSLRQDNASFRSQVNLLQMLDIQILNRKEFKLDCTLEVRAIAKSMLKKFNQIKAETQLAIIVPKFLHYQIGLKGYYEMLAIEFVKHIEKINFKNKARLLYWFALADIDSSFILKTAHKLCASYSEAFLHQSLSGMVEIPQIGLFSEQQIRYITDASRDIRENQLGIAKIDKNTGLESENAAEEAIQKHHDKIEFEETSSLIKIVWAYMVFSQSSTADKEFKFEHKILWEKLVDLLNKKLKRFPTKNEDFVLKSFDLDNLNQVNAFLKLEMNFNDKSLLKIPADIKFGDLSLFKTSANKEKEYQGFVQKVHSYLKSQDLQLPQNSFYDFYRLYGGSNLESTSKRDRKYYVFNQKHWYFEDTKTYNSFVRVRREHFKKLGVVKVAEIDFYDFLQFKKRHAQIMNESSKDQEEEETLFTLDDKIDNKEKDPVIAYLKNLIKNLQ